VLALPDPQPVSMFDNVYPDGSPEVDAQRAQFEQYQASFDGSAH
jgi:2-oxoisovalerate dehydrogenase E1 component alpha subunit